MFEIIIDGVTYQFRFGMGFMREVNKLVSKPIDNIPNKSQNVGLQYMIGGIIDGDMETLVEVLTIANKGQNPRVTPAMLDAYIDDENTDIDKLFEDVIDFLKNANATKKVTNTLLELVAEQKAKAAAQK